ncbi:TetR/AcrR family transcriptional regulator [uncultured Sphingomonas sp.]|uniref:TetR/AcrR family transcriptional regulator n=1 Tax=uncultured Sphingomonas sp. TaxID=158754 RepID=UPI002588DDAE|nr:TetR/AcrR family transcriptional regulator [uncultured Sphingomonas sp.]
MTHTDMDDPPAPLERGGKANARREKVVQAARILFAEQGFHATGMAAISQASGVLVGQIYRDFANKEAIVAAIVERDLDEYLREGELHETCACDDPAQLRGWIARFVACEDIPDRRLIAEIMAEAARNIRVADIFRELETRLYGRLIDALRILAPHANARRFDCVAETILILSGGIFHHRLAHDGAIDDDVLERLLKIAVNEIDALIDQPA